MQLETLHNIKNALRNVYAWPGGYPMYLVMADCEPLSIAAARKNWRYIVAAHLNDDWRNPWAVAGIEINYENDELICCVSCEPIESAYGDNDVSE